MLKMNRLRGPFEKQRRKRAQTLLKSERQKPFHIDWSLWRQLSSKKSLLVIWIVLTLFVNTLTADDKYSLRKRDNVRQPIHMQLSQKERICVNFVLYFWNLD